MADRILVTGCSGYVASHLMGELRASHARARITGVAIAGAGRADERIDETVTVDLRDGAAVHALIDAVRPDSVVHLAAARTGPLDALLATNVVATDRLLRAVRELVPDARVIVVGSSAELGAATGDGRPLDETAPCRPLDDYGVSKLAQSAIAAAAFLRHGQHVVRVRLFNLVGPDLPESLLPGRCARALARVVAGGGGGHLSFGDLETRRDYVDIRDACRAIALALERGAAGELFHVGSGVAVSGREIVSRLVAEAREETGPVTFDEKVAGLPTVPTQQADPGHAKHALGWRPEIPLDRSLRDLWHSVRGLPEVSPRRGGGS